MINSVVNTGNKNNRRIKAITSSVDNSIVRFDATTGDVVQGSLATIDDTGSVNIPTGQAYKINGSAITTADVADSTDKRYCTDAQKTVIGNTSGTNTGDETVTTIKDKLGITTLSGSNTGDETTTTIGTIVNGATAKITIADADMIPLMDSEATNVIKKLSWSYVKSILKTYFDGLYTLSNLGGVSTSTTVNSKALSSNITLTTSDIADSTNKRYCTDAQKTIIGNTSGSNSGDETTSTIKTKLGITTLSGSNTGDETVTTIKAALGITTLSGSNTGDDTTTTIGNLINGATAKTTLSSNDLIALSDSAASNIVKKVTISDLQNNILITLNLKTIDSGNSKMSYGEITDCGDSNGILLGIYDCGTSVI